MMAVNADFMPVIFNKTNNTNDTITLCIQPMEKFDRKFVPYKNDDTNMKFGYHT